MNSKPTIFLRDDQQVVDLDGMELTVSELKDAVIDSKLYRRELTRILGGK